MWTTLLAIGLWPCAASEQTWPDKPVHVVVPLTAGSATDAMAGSVVQRLSLQLGQPFIVDNKPGALNYGSAGVGTANRLNAERFRVGAPIDAVHVPFKGTPESVNEVLAGRVDDYFCPVNVCLPVIYDKRVLALGVASSKRSAALPDLPTTIELGVPDSDDDFWVGMFVPAETPREIVDKLYTEVAKAFASQKVKESLAQLGAQPNIIEPEGFDAEIKKEITNNAALVKPAGIPIVQ